MLSYHSNSPVGLVSVRSAGHNNVFSVLKLTLLSTVDAQTIGLFYTISGIAGMFIQFLFFPPIVQRFGVLRCFRVAALSMPIIFFLTPFIALTPEPFRIPSVLLILFAKLGSIIFAIPCCTILLTNSASSVTVLGTLNGVATSVSALGRAAGPALIGTVFSWGVERGYVIIPWWLLSALTLTSVIPAIWIVEQDGPHREVEEEEEEEVQGENGSVGTYGAVNASNGANRR
jgi:MFS family permease